MSKIDEARKELDFQNELKALINRYNREQRSDTADFILAAFMHECLRAYETAIYFRELHPKPKIEKVLSKQ
jgi:hypothetical protein